MTQQSSDTGRFQVQKQAAIKAAAAVFSEKGYHGASTRDIAERLGIKQGSLYYYFESKEAALEEVCLYGLQSYVGNLDVIVDSDAALADKLFSVVMNHLASYREKNEALKVHNDERLYLSPERRTRLKALGSHYRQQLEAMFDAGIQSEELRANLDSHFAAVSVIGICNSFGEHIVREADIELFALARKCTDLLLGGMVARQTAELPTGAAAAGA